MNIRAEIADRRPPVGAGRTSLDRPFYAAVAVFALIVTALGFQEFFFWCRPF